MIGWRLRALSENWQGSQAAAHTVIRFLWVSAKFSTCTVVRVNGTLVEDKMRRFKGECEHFRFYKCPIYTHDGASAKFSTNSQEMDNSAEFLHLAVTWLANNIRTATWLAGAALSSLIRFSSSCSESCIWLLRDWLIISELSYDWLALPWVLWQGCQAAALNPASGCYVIG